MLRHVALVNESTDLSRSNLLAVSAALQKQVSRDFGPIWNISATVDAFDDRADVPFDYWQVRIVDQLPDPRDIGFHKTANNQPYAMVLFTDDWSIAASHEVLEMLADPSGDRLVASQSVEPSLARVNYLLEVCDPVQDAKYTVNNIEVCDFYTPNFFDPVTVAGVRYSFSGSLHAPKLVLRGGYLSFLDPATGNWWRQEWFSGPRPTFINVGPDKIGAQGALRAERESLREMMDRITYARKVSKRIKVTAKSRSRSKKS